MPISLLVTSHERHQFAEFLIRPARKTIGTPSMEVLSTRTFLSLGKSAFDNARDQADHARALSAQCRHQEALKSLARAFRLLDQPTTEYLQRLENVHEESRLLLEAIEEALVYGSAKFVCSRAGIQFPQVEKFNMAGRQIARTYNLPYSH